ncbi:MAG: PEP-CTERM sorting domain-containing protein [Planctomycetota bacterium]|nr:PEP-CTERM sorting domain-containing protein [Planctomycetota bacterium]
MRSKAKWMCCVVTMLGLVMTCSMAQAAMIDSYLSPEKDEYKYATGFGDDHVIPSWTAIDFTGAIVNNSDKYLTDALALGTWSRTGTQLGAMSSTPTELVYKVSMPDEGASGYTIDDGEIHVVTHLYGGGGRAVVEMFLSTNNVDWSAALVSHETSTAAWQDTAEDINIPDAYLGGDTIYVKFTGCNPPANDWASLEHWGIRLDLVPEPASVSMLLLGAVAMLRRRKK